MKFLVLVLAVVLCAVAVSAKPLKAFAMTKEAMQARSKQQASGVQLSTKTKDVEELNVEENEELKVANYEAALNRPKGGVAGVFKGGLGFFGSGAGVFEGFSTGSGCKTCG